LNKQKLTAIFVPAFIVLALDQITKWLVRTSPELQNKVLIEGWLQFYYTKNSGMALGIDLFSTPVISVIAILAVSGILFYILKNINEATIGYLFCMGLIIGGAFGNISDRIFMGIVGGYGGVLEGHVVDFIYFSLKIGDWTVFPYIFNVADVAISCSIIFILIFNRRFFMTQNGESENEGALPENDGEVKPDSSVN
jgi:signal peptidase II